jgi:3',5'-cyclic AMP phosphodiesterase CpdA
MTENNQIDRRGFLKCMQWVGTGIVWSFAGGIPVSRLLGDTISGADTDFRFVQISDTHIGFNRPANTDVAGTLDAVIGKINALAEQPDLILHTGDLTHQAKADEFDTLDQRLRSLRQRNVFYVPGEHDLTGDDGHIFRDRFKKMWQSFDHNGVHFVGLNNCAQLDGLGNIGTEQMDWLAKDLSGLADSTPVVVFAHIPLWALYPKWGWGTKDSEQALGLLKRFGSVTVLNGHIHQVMQKVEGSVTFHTAMSTAFPQAAPGDKAGPGALKVPDDQLRRVLGIAEVNFVAGKHELAVVDSALE